MEKKLLINPTKTAPLLSGRWSLADIRKFIDSPNVPTGIFANLTETISRFIDLPDVAIAFLALWVVGTYFTHGFYAYPYLFFEGPKETGKSKILELLAYVCFNGVKVRDITKAALGDVIDNLRGSLFIDQAEDLDEDLVGLLADGYKKSGGTRRVVEVTKAGRVVHEFQTYGPKAFGATKDLDDDLKDRCIRIPMIRTAKSLPDLDGNENLWAEIRDALYRFQLTMWPTVRQHYFATQGEGTRASELWRPIQAIINTLEIETDAVEKIRAFFFECTKQTRHKLGHWEDSVFEALKIEANGHSGDFKLSVNDLKDLIGIDEMKIGWLGKTLQKYSLCPSGKRPTENGKKLTVYTFNPAHILKMCDLYQRENDDESLC